MVWKRRKPWEDAMAHQQVDLNKAYYRGKNHAVYGIQYEQQVDNALAKSYAQGWRDAKGESCLNADTEWD